MLVRHVGLVSLSRQVPLAQVTQLAAALQKQVTRDFFPLWGIPATVDAFASPHDIPTGYWPILIQDHLDEPGAAGLHKDSHGQPIALVDAQSNLPLTCSHELLEMLVDPSGDRLIASDSLIPSQGRVLYLVEVCDPSQRAAFGYRVNGLTLSDFYLPQYFDPVKVHGVRYSFTGSIRQPKGVLPGGYLSWMVPQTREWWQATFFRPKLEFRGPLQLSQDRRCWRQIVDEATSPLHRDFPTKAARP